VRGRERESERDRWGRDRKRETDGREIGGERESQNQGERQCDWGEREREVERVTERKMGRERRERGKV